MAHGLRGIVNAGYMPYGSGRDWFFIGDFQYQNGRRTPDANLRWREEKKGMVPEGKRRPRGEPTEISMTKSLHKLQASSSSSKNIARSMSPRACERLRRQQSEPTVNDMLQANSAGAAHAARWKEANTSKRPTKANSCLRKTSRDLSLPPYGTGTSASQELGQVHLLGHDYTFSEYGAPEKFRYHSSRVQPPSKEETDEHMKEFPGKQKLPATQAAKFYQNALAETEKPIDKPLSKTTTLEWGHPMKHHHCSNKKCFPPKDVEREQPEKPSGWRPPEYGVPDKHRYHQPPLWAPKDDLGASRIPPGKQSEIPTNWKRTMTETMVQHCTTKNKLYM